MKAVRYSSLMVVLFLLAGIAVFLVSSGTAPAQTSPWKKEDCVKCHAGPVNGIETAGGKHKSVPCVGCHLGHPPEVKRPIAQCNKCHLKTRKAHFGFTGCLTCHKNPHTPLKISFEGMDACNNCHAHQVDQLRDNKSKHSNLGCSTCHSVHRQVPQCNQCHKPHSDKVAAGCNKCHNAHMPKAITYAADIPSKDCGACHKKAADLLSAGNSKHKPFECAFCHQGKHRMMPTCQDCHGTPHPAGIMAKFPQCAKCHNVAHDLNNWTAAETRETPEEALKKQTSYQPAR